MGFIQNMKDLLNKEYNVSVTENGAVGYRTTGKALLDMNFAVSSMRNESAEELVERFVKAYYENPALALRWLFYAGDVRQGLGERRLFRTILCYLAQSHVDIARALMPLVPEYSRWDVVVALLDTPLGDEAAGFIQKQLQEDSANMEKGESISLCAKWLPSENASASYTKCMARLLADKLSMTSRQYRQTLSLYRKYLNVVEVKMSRGDWAGIDYSAVPSRANLVYNRAFLRNDEIRRREFLGAVQKGEKQIHAGVLYPHDIVHSYFDQEKRAWTGSLRSVDVTLEELWKALPDFVQGAGSTLCVADGSGSMFSTVGNSGVRCLDVANALAIYFSERCTGQFKDNYITFSQNPQFVDLSRAGTLHDKLELALAHNEVANTDIQAVFELILHTAVKNHMPQQELPTNVLILSDMEFDSATRYVVNDRWVSPDERLFDTIAKSYAARGYRMPRLVFWNICSRTCTIPVRENDCGVALVSGFSPTIVKMVLGSELDPYKILVEQLSAPRYDAVENAVEGLLQDSLTEV
ncbi:MAG: DUF2828 domain-containing protein [Butyrivibrio sp.]|nr:DUF2828 domain-containing protein [Muribaculum sp.]MCM1553345.1 DUF2828 domain-containing protein [Butyrivibrio sp.]